MKKDLSRPSCPKSFPGFNVKYQNPNAKENPNGTMTKFDGLCRGDSIPGWCSEPVAVRVFEVLFGIGQLFLSFELYHLAFFSA